MGQCNLICFNKKLKNKEPSNDIVCILENSEESNNDQGIPQQPDNENP